MAIQEKSLTHWVEKYTQDLYAWALNKVSDPELASDLVQDTFLAAAEKIDGFKGESSPKTWLFSILNYKIIDIYRKKVKAPVNVDSDSISKYFDTEGVWFDQKRPATWDTEDDKLLDNEEFQIIFNDCIDNLPEKWSSTVKLKYITDKKGKEICQELDLAPTNYWQILHRAKLQLRECLEKNWFQQ